MNVLPALQTAGVSVQRVRAEQQRVRDRQVDAILDLTLGKARARFAVEEKRRAPYPNELPKLQPPGNRSPASAHPCSRALRVGATRHRGDASRLVLGRCRRQFDLRADSLVLRQRSKTDRPRTRASRLPQGSGSLAIIRALIGFPRGTNEDREPPRWQTRWARSQPRGSQVLRKLLVLDLVTRSPEGRWLPDREALLDRFLSEYRGPAVRALPVQP